MESREIQEFLMNYFCDKLRNLTGIEFNKRDVNKLPANMLTFSAEGAYIDFVYDMATFDETNLDNLNISVETVRLNGLDLSVDDIYNLQDVIRNITKKDYVVYLSIVTGIVTDFSSMVTIKKRGRNALTNLKEIDRPTLEKLKAAYDKHTLSVINTKKIEEIDFKYKEFLLSRNPIDFGNHWYFILDNE